MENEIVADIEKTFVIRSKNYVKWESESAYKNFSRFYAIKSRYAKGKMEHCGAGEFLLLVVEDKIPVYESRETNDGVVIVNKNLFDKKSLYRKWTNEGHKIHATNTVAETSHNLALFFGVTYQEYLDALSSGDILTPEGNLIGHNGWRSFSELFKVMNETMKYVVLRNFEGFFDEIVCDEHLDIDLLVWDYNEAKLVSNSLEVYPYNNRVVNRVLVAGEMVDFDFRNVEDNYMDKNWSKEIINNRVLDEVGFYKPNEEYYFYSLLYHALIHKEEISSDYLNRFKMLGSKIGVNLSNIQRKTLVELLTKYIKTKDIDITEPADVSVFYNTNDYRQNVSFYRKYLTAYRSLKRALKPYILRLVK